MKRPSGAICECEASVTMVKLLEMSGLRNILQIQVIGIEWRCPKSKREVMCTAGRRVGEVELTTSALHLRRLYSEPQKLNIIAARFGIFPSRFWFCFDVPCDATIHSFEMRMFICCHYKIELCNVFVL